MHERNQTRGGSPARMRGFKRAAAAALVLPAVVGLLGSRADLVALIKPQFEAGREHVGKGIVRDEAVQRAVCEDIDAFLRTQDFDILGLIASPILGGDGNREFLIGAHRG